MLIHMLATWVLDLVNLEYYPSLWAKYHDPDRIKYQDQRAWAYKYYKSYCREMIGDKKFRTAWELKKAQMRSDYRVMYNIMIDWDHRTDYI